MCECERGCVSVRDGVCVSVCEGVCECERGCV